MKNRKTTTTTTTKAKNGKTPKFMGVTIGPFRVYFSPHHVKREGVWIPSGDLSMKLEVGDGWPATVLGWGPEGNGSLATVHEHSDHFNTAVAEAVARWSDDAIYSQAMDALRQYIATKTTSPTPEPLRIKTGLVSRVATIKG